MTKARIFGSQDVLAGLMFILIGAAALALSSAYPHGTSTRMGPGYFPTLLGWLLTGLGALIAARGVLSPGASVPGGSPRCALVLAAVVAFGLLLKPAGLAIATAVLVGLGAVANRDFRAIEIVLIYLVLIAIAIVVFVYGVGVQLSIGPA
ncbi:tripartite tricarboxylate transporter TctB family protein [Azospirillum rugosum]|uniref:DUF1468 domain-containing protein n=1 Tax=Azospirillum rugosum TaxID=416170 RepID=A0ABS4SQV8_9PROT|nr:tripartite tricarboxylate transporter TctB family protein [Azospirillum rugosum]MBP2294962.1 hypothetical protein [Azospirillum rugosum]MDQ0530988.1 hypothetical protein [Azospirillum rugosum]